MSRAPRIHAWCERLVRCSDGRNHELGIVSLICAEAKRQGKQYTKRMLPWFVIPECNIRLDLVVKLLRLVERDPGPAARSAPHHRPGLVQCPVSVARSPHRQQVRQDQAARQSVFRSPASPMAP